jgi:Ring finger domain
MVLNKTWVPKICVTVVCYICWQRIRVKNNEEDSIHSSRATLTKSDATKTGSSDGTTDNADCGGCCSICLEDFCDGDEICESYNCRHQFHMNGCMSKWLLGHDECPVCRRDYLQCNHRICRSHHGKTRNYYVDPVPVNGLYDSGYYADDRWRFREAGLTAMGEFPPWFW